jgi:integrase
MKRAQSVTRLRKDPRHWKQHLQRLINQHNHLHATKRKGVSFKTMEDRANFLFYFFGELRHNEEKCFKPCPDNLANNHVGFMVERWLRQGAPASTLQLRLSFLRTFCKWIHKDGMIYPPERYVTDPSLLKRCYAARKDKSWTAHDVVPDAKIDEIEQVDPYVGVQLRMALRYGLRVKEAIMCQPHLAEVDAGLQVIAADRIEPRLKVERGTKGGRRRVVPIDSEAKRVALAAAKRLARFKDAHLGRPGRTLQQNQRRFYYVLQKFGITKDVLGVTAHGLRHQYANDRYEEYAGTASPVRSGEPIERETDHQARLRVVEELGHARSTISNAYLGSSVVMRSKVARRPLRDDASGTPAAEHEDATLSADAPASDEGGKP